MFITKKTQLGLTLLVDIAFYGSPTKPVKRKWLIQRSQKNKDFIDEILLKLKIHKLIASVKGRDGGYYALKNTDDISVLDIVRALETADTLKEGESWDFVNTSLIRYLRRYTIAELMEETLDQFPNFFPTLV
jgi:Rrf2 family protein